MSQIGYMFLAVGIGAYSAGFFHLLSHAFFKALLFMAAGNVIHAMHDEQDMRKYGGPLAQMRPASIPFFVSPPAPRRLIPPLRFSPSTAAVVVRVVTMAVAALIFVAALRMRPWSAAVPWAQPLLERKYYFDEIYDAVFVRPMDALANFGLRDVEQPVIGGAVVGTGELAEESASGL